MARGGPGQSQRPGALLGLPCQWQETIFFGEKIYMQSGPFYVAFPNTWQVAGLEAEQLKLDLELIRDAHIRGDGLT